jgi:hypothetical protein
MFDYSMGVNNTINQQNIIEQQMTSLWQIVKTNAKKLHITHTTHYKHTTSKITNG